MWSNIRWTPPGGLHQAESVSLDRHFPVLHYFRKMIAKGRKVLLIGWNHLSPQKCSMRAKVLIKEVFKAKFSPMVATSTPADDKKIDDLLSKASVWLAKLECDAPTSVTSAQCRRLKKDNLVSLFSDAFQLVRFQNDRLR